MSCNNLIKIKYANDLSTNSNLIFFIIVENENERNFIKVIISKEAYNFNQFNSLVKNTNNIFLCEKVEIEKKPVPYIHGIYINLNVYESNNQLTNQFNSGFTLIKDFEYSKVFDNIITDINFKYCIWITLNSMIYKYHKNCFINVTSFEANYEKKFLEISGYYNNNGNDNYMFRTYEHIYNLNKDNNPLIISNNESEIFIPILMHNGKITGYNVEISIGFNFSDSEPLENFSEKKLLCNIDKFPFDRTITSPIQSIMIKGCLLTCL